ncbi:hypothetical protein SLS62_006452 [Diatrype stigma]|uniref:Uncharacterized protein n=1 Tax=Diatrype stigma TaxID=117547 RepID=A0AAN9YP34_9PEZI
MAFGKWRLSRGRKGSNSSAEHDASTNGTTTPVESEGQSITKPRSHEPSQSSILRTLTGTLKPPRPRRLTEKDSEYARLHKPFTKQNLEHQKILSAFEWNFGASTNQRTPSICSGISPCTSRQGSVDHDNLYPPSSRTDTRARVSSDLGYGVSLDRLARLNIRGSNKRRADSPSVKQLEAVY